jgi:hypothetical protein
LKEKVVGGGAAERVETRERVRRVGMDFFIWSGGEWWCG